jgi:YVTN family beta-propeller protein
MVKLKLNTLFRVLSMQICTFLFIALCITNIAFSSSKAYITNFHSNTVSVIDFSKKNAVVATIEVGKNPIGIAATPQGKFVYVTNSGSDSMSIIDTNRDEVISTIAVEFSTPYGIAITPDGKYVYITNSNSHTVSVINLSTKKVSKIPVGTNPFGLAVTPDSKYVYIVNHASSSISVIDTAIQKVVTTIAVNLFPTLVSISKDGKYAYVTNQPNDIFVIDVAEHHFVSTIPIGSDPFGVAFGITMAPNGKKAYVSDYQANTISSINLANHKVEGVPIAVGNHPRGLAVTADGRYAYVINNGSNSVSFVDLSTHKVEKSISVGLDPRNLVLIETAPPAPEKAPYNSSKSPKSTLPSQQKSKPTAPAKTQPPKKPTTPDPALKNTQKFSPTPERGSTLPNSKKSS